MIGYLQVRTVRVETRKNEVVNRLNKTKTEQTPDLKGGVFPEFVMDSAVRNYYSVWILMLD